MAISTREWVFTHPGAQEFGAGLAAEADAVLLGAPPALAGATIARSLVTPAKAGVHRAVAPIW
ncbi:MAG: hypothetical protein JO358_08925 [Alphaproteobacteria bacterium]|nr:hypothetical protein [Alphaproteobacteria bacterium]